MTVWTPDEEAKRLAQRFEALSAAGGIGKAKFAQTYAVPGGASMLSQHITGRRPLSMEAAIAYARGFQVPVSEISPRLAKLAMEAVATEVKPSAGPVESSPRTDVSKSAEGGNADFVLQPIERDFVLAARQIGVLREVHRISPMATARSAWAPGWRLTSDQKEAWAADAAAKAEEDQA